MRFLLLSLLLVGPLPAQEPPKPSYVYWAEFVRVIDGDTVVMDLDLGFGVWMRGQVLDLLNVGLPNVTDADKAETLKRAARLRELLKDRGEYLVQTVKDKKEPRHFFATIWADGINVNEAVKPK